jgi:superfamily I DNA/RNA helicase
VVSRARHVLVVAGPGSGKTRVLASRYALLLASGLRAENLLAVTFTNRAALEMRSRVAALTCLEEEALNKTPLAIGTFHGFCLKFLKKERPGFRIISRGEQLSVIRELGPKSPAMSPARTLQAISRVKNLLFSEGRERPPADEDALVNAYDGALRERAALDLDDLILETIGLLREREGLLARYHSALSHILVDEFQDINPPQAELVKILAPAGGGGPEGAAGAAGACLFAIGDPDQSIYSFRGANLRGFSEFEKTYPGSDVRTLKTNYRSTGNIVLASSALVANNPVSRRMGPVRGASRPVRGAGEDVAVVECRDEKLEAAFVINRIEALMGGLSSLTVGGGGGRARGECGDGEEVLRFSDFAVLARTNRQARAFAELMRSSNVPCQLVGPPADISQFMEEIRGDSLPDGVGLDEFVKSRGEALGVDPPLLAALVHTAGTIVNSAWDSVREDPLGAFLEHLALMQPVDTYDIEADRVAVMTLHMAKGLEFPVVFITGVEDGLIPLRTKSRPPDTEEGIEADNEVETENEIESEIEEERRLFYVGMTRAVERLFLLRAANRRLWGSTSETRRSPFLDEFPSECLENVEFKRKRPKKRPRQDGLFD